MDKSEKNMKDFLSAIKMGCEIFKVYKQNANNFQLKEIIEQSQQLFDQHQIKIRNQLTCEGYDNECDLKRTQKLAIKMEKMIVKDKSDFDLCLNIICSMKTAMTKGLTFLFRNKDDVSIDFLHAAKEVVRDYDNVQLRFKEYAINLI